MDRILNILDRKTLKTEKYLTKGVEILTNALF